MPEVDVERQGPMLTITINRPAARNAIALTTMAELEGVLDQIAHEAVAVVVLRGGGDRAFVSGGDLKELAALRTAEEAAAMAVRMRRVLDKLVRLPMPTIAALNGHALGGGAEVAVACDLRLAAEDITIAFNQAQLAIMPAWGGVERLVDLVGRSKAMQLLLTRTRLGATQAEAVGLLNLTVPRSDFDREVETFARQIAELPIPVTRAIKSTVDIHRPNTHPDSESSAVKAFAQLWVTDDHWAAADRLRKPPNHDASDSLPGQGS